MAGLLSFPSRERGLKLAKDYTDLEESIVVPFAGTWIEILCTVSRKYNEICRSLRGNVD